jgi:hypothetical protein
MNVDAVAVDRSHSTGMLPLSHLIALTGPYGVYEHARGETPRIEHGYCTDDAARVLAVIARERVPRGFAAGAQLRHLTNLALSFLEQAVAPDGAVRNRMSADGAWTDAPSIGDWWGRAVCGLGSAVRHSPDPGIRARALRVFLRAARRSSPDVRASAFAAIGAADILEALPGTVAARALLTDSLRRIPRPHGMNQSWPEQRLRYANGALCEALIAGGQALQQPGMIDTGLMMLQTLLRLETRPSGVMSFVGAGGRDRSDPERSGDQQPIEPATIAEACMRAAAITRDEKWSRAALRTWAWFTGENDAGIAMFDPETGAGYDGLEPGGRNENRGAESTLAALSAYQCARYARGART